MAGGRPGGGRERSSQEFTVIREDLQGLGRPPTEGELYPLKLLEFGLFGALSPAPFQKSSLEAGFDRNKEGGA